jgi:hypothetical protein
VFSRNPFRLNSTSSSSSSSDLLEIRAEDLRLSSPKLFSEMMERNRWNLPGKSSE